MAKEKNGFNIFHKTIRLSIIISKITIHLLFLKVIIVQITIVIL